MRLTEMIPPTTRTIDDCEYLRKEYPQPTPVIFRPELYKPIMVSNGHILDGLSRYTLAKAAGIEELETVGTPS